MLSLNTILSFETKQELCMTNLVMSMGLVLIAGNGLAAETKSSSPKKDSPVTWESYRCEKFSDGDLAELKKRLLDNCNVNLPHSFSVAKDSLSRSEIFYYCCHKRDL
jgi:hypothetical protein